MFSMIGSRCCVQVKSWKMMKKCHDMKGGGPLMVVWPKPLRRQWKRESKGYNSYLTNHEYARKDKRKGYEALGTENPHTGGMPKDRGCSLNTVEIGLRKGFFPGKFCTVLLVRGTISFCKGKLQFCLLERVKFGMYQCDSMNNVEEELFRFQRCFIYCENVQFFEPMFLLNVLQYL